MLRKTQEIERPFRTNQGIQRFLHELVFSQLQMEQKNCVANLIIIIIICIFFLNLQHSEVFLRPCVTLKF